MIRSFTSESTILPKAAPMMTATARSITFPLTAKSRKSFSIDMMVSSSSCYRLSGLARANPHDLLDRGNEYLAVTDLAGACRLDDGIDRALDQAVGDDDFDLDLGQKIDDVLGAAVKLGVPFLP